MLIIPDWLQQQNEPKSKLFHTRNYLSKLTDFTTGATRKQLLLSRFIF